MKLRDLLDILDESEEESLDNLVGIIINGELKLIKTVCEWNDFIELGIEDEGEGVN